MAKKRWKDYQEYLQSEEWKELRKKTYERVEEETNGEHVCEFCHQKNKLQVHHWKYPKNWENDDTKYHILLCEDCHKRIHEIPHYNSFKTKKEYENYYLRFILTINKYFNNSLKRFVESYLANSERRMTLDYINDEDEFVLFIDGVMADNLIKDFLISSVRASYNPDSPF